MGCFFSEGVALFKHCDLQVFNWVAKKVFKTSEFLASCVKFLSSPTSVIFYEDFV